MRRLPGSSNYVFNGKYHKEITDIPSELWECRGVVGQSFSLDAKASFDPTGSGNALTYTWDFGDGTTDNGLTVNHTYRTTGNYTFAVVLMGMLGFIAVRMRRRRST